MTPMETNLANPCLLSNLTILLPGIYHKVTEAKTLSNLYTRPLKALFKIISII